MRNESTRARGWKFSARKFLASAAAIAVSAVSLAAVPGTASAAELDGVVDPESIQITKTSYGIGDPIGLWDDIQIDADFVIPEGAMQGDTFTFAIPEQFNPKGATEFGLEDATNPDNNLASCVLPTEPGAELFCTLTDQFTGEEGDTKGSLWISARVEETHDKSTVIFTIDGEEHNIALPDGQQGIGYPVPAGWITKWGNQVGDDKLSWEINIPGALFQGAEIPVVVTDTLVADGENYLPQEFDENSFWVSSHPADGGPSTNEHGVFVLTSTVDGVVTFESTTELDPNKVYRIGYNTTPLEKPVLGDNFANHASVNGEFVASEVNWDVAGGGAGTQTKFGRFSIVKLIQGEQDLPEGTEFEVIYTVEDDPTEHSLILTPGDAPVYSIRAEAGSTFTLEEVNFPQVEGIESWEPVFSGNNVVVTEDGAAQVTPAAQEIVAVTLTNTAIPEQPVISVSVGDLVWFDQNDNGLQDDGAESGLEGVGLTISRTDGEPVTDINGTPVFNTQTDDQGYYSFDDLPVLPEGERYVVAVSAPEGYQPAKANVGDDAGDDSSTGYETAVELTEDGARDDTLDFGFILIAPDPVEPTEPTEPSEPAEPAEPSKPAEPSEPAQPTQPVEPTEPAEPTQTPKDPVPSEKPLPETGSSLSTILAASGALLLMMGLALMIVRSKSFSLNG